jgi:hypothetical protein
MKRFTTFLLLSAFAGAHLASAQENKSGRQAARQNAAVAKMATRNPMQARRTVRVQPNVQRKAPMTQNFRARSSSGGSADTRAVLNRTLRNTPNVPVTRTPPAANAVNNQNLADRRNWNRDGNGQNDNIGADKVNRSHGKLNNNRGAGVWQKGKGNVQNRHWNPARNHNWERQRHDRSWWTSRYSRFALFGGGYYYWNSGYWYPAYGYHPSYNTYSYNAPIYAYNDQDPGQVIADVQSALQRLGYSPGPLDGTYGPMTRNALLGYQRENGLPESGEIDEATLASLGLE